MYTIRDGLRPSSGPKSKQNLLFLSKLRGVKAAGKLLKSTSVIKFLAASKTSSPAGKLTVSRRVRLLLVATKFSMESGKSEPLSAGLNESSLWSKL